MGNLISLNEFKSRVLIFSLLLIVGLVFVFTQSRVIYAEGAPYDAGAYVQVAGQVASSKAISTLKPFAYRVGLPYLVGKFFPQNILNGFEIINVVFGVLSLGVLIALIAGVTRSKLILVAVCLLWVANPHAPFRFAPFFPALTDPPALFFMLLILFLQTRNVLRGWHGIAILSLLTIAGVLFREVALVATLAVTIANFIRYAIDGEGQNSIDAQKIFVALIPTGLGFATIFFTHVIAVGVGDYTFWGAAIESLQFKVSKPDILVLGFLMAFGPVVVLFFAVPFTLFQHAIKNHTELFVYLFVIGGLALAGGFHTDRFWYWGFIAVLPLIAMSLEELICIHGWNRLLPFFVFLLVLQCLAFRVCNSIPNADFDALAVPGAPQLWLLAPYGEGSNSAQMYAAYMGDVSRRIVFGEYVALGIVSIVWVYLIRMHTPVPSTKSNAGE